MKRRSSTLIPALLLLGIANPALTAAPAANDLRAPVEAAATSERHTHMAIGTNFWNFAWGGGRADYFVDGIDWTTVENPWRPDFLEQIQIYRVLRFVDQVPINSSRVRTWDERTLPDANHYNTLRGAVAYEWQIDLCNRIGADLWVNVPHLTIEDYESTPHDNYWTELAKLVKEKLDPNLNVYVEYSNETWSEGAGFQQGDYVGLRGVQFGFHPNFDFSKDYFNVYAAMRLHHVFLTVFDDQQDRVKTVLAGRSGTAPTHLLNALNNRSAFSRHGDPRLNPWEYTPDYFAISAYIGGVGANGADPNIRQFWSDQVAANIAGNKSLKDAVEAAGMRLITYEGGQYFTVNSHIFSENPESYDMYMEWLEAIEDIFELNMHSTHLGRWVSAASWGAKSSTDQSIEDAHRYRALVHFAERYVAPENRVLWNLDLLPEGEADGWLDEWLGWVYYSPDIYPWSHILGLGWVYVATEDRDSAWFWVEGADWLFAGASHYAYCYFAPTNSWIHHARGTPEFYDWASDSYLTLPQLIENSQ